MLKKYAREPFTFATPIVKPHVEKIFESIIENIFGAAKCRPIYLHRHCKRCGMIYRVED